MIMAGAPISATTPTTLWRGVHRVVVSCEGPSVRALAAGIDLCREVLAEASRGSPYPVVSSDAANPVISSDVVLRVTARVTDEGATKSLQFSIVPLRDDPRSETNAPARVPGAPTVVPLGAEALRAGVAAQLDKILPWRSDRRGRVGPIKN
jgi:hypothetical protein